MSPDAKPRGRVLVADDEESMRVFVRRALTRQGYEVDPVEDGEAAVARFAANAYDAVVLDLVMPRVDGLAALRAIRERDPDAVVLLMTAHGTIPSAVEAMRAGAAAYVTKPFEIEELLVQLERAVEQRATKRENRALRRLVDERTAYGGLVGRSPAMQSLYRSIELVAESDGTVLITGESGTGKELVARAIHARSRRAEAPFVAVACALLEGGTVDSQLFGHVRGAFTGAQQARRGLIARASGGTLLFDEVASLPLSTQAKLERFLQEHEITPLGATQSERHDVRVIAATNHELGELAASGAIRSELFYRLDVLRIAVPPLRERRDDIPVLAEHLLARHGADVELTDAAIAALCDHDWPGNVRELENTLERLLALAGDRQVIDAADLPERLVPSAPGSPGGRSFHETVEEAERSYLRELMQRTGGNVTEAARLARISRGHLHRKLAKLGLAPETFR